MKIPESVRIGGIEHTVVRERRLNNGENLLCGQIRYMDCRITIEAECSHEYACLTLWHEILHGIENQMQLDLGGNGEHIIEAFARGVYQVLQDNGGRLFDLTARELTSYPDRAGCAAQEEKVCGK